MAGAGDVQRLILQVDAAVEIAKRNLRDLASSVDREAANMDRSLGRVDTATNRMGQKLASVGQFRGGMQQLSFQIGDVAQQMSLGTRASIIFAQQSGQVIQAIQLMNTGTSGFLKFLGGPWGIVLTTATVVLSSFIGKLFDNGKEIDRLVDKMRDQARQAELNRKADEAWKQTIEGVTDAIRKRREEQEKGLKTDLQEEQASLAAAKKELADQRAGLGTRRGDLRAAEGDVATARSGYAKVAGTNLAGPAQARLQAAQAKVDQLKRDIQALEQQIIVAEANIRGAEIPIAERRVEARVDATAKATDRYTAALGRLRNQLRAGKIDQATFEKELEVARRKRDADIKAAQAANSSADRQSGRQVSGTEAASIARAGGLQVNSVGRSYGQQKALYDAWVAAGKPKDNPVAAPGTSAHEGAKGKWALDIQITDGVGPAKIRKIFADQGVSLSKVLKEKGHFHIEGSRSEAAAADRTADRAAEQKNDQDDNFRSQKSDLDQQLLAAQMALVTGITAQAEYAAKEVDRAQSDYEAGLEKDVREGRLREEQAKLLVEKSKAVSAQRKANIEAKKIVDQLEQQNRNLQQESEFRLEGLRYQDEIARTQAEHRRIQLEIIAALYAQRDADLKLAKAKAEAAGDAEEANRIQGQIDELPTQRSRDEDSARRGSQDPLQAWMESAPQNIEELNEAFHQIIADGAEDLTGEIGDATVRMLGLGKATDSVAAQMVAAMARVIAKMLIAKAMMAAFNAFGGGVGAGIGGAASGTAGMSSAIGYAGLPGYASGGFMAVGGMGGIDNNIVSINGRPRFRASANEVLAVVPPRVGVPRQAIGSSGGVAGDTFHVTVTAPNTGDPRADRRSALQSAGLVQDAIARRTDKGLVR